MNLIDRYIGKDLFLTTFFAVGMLSIVLVLGNIFKQLLDLLVNHDVPLEYIASFIGYILPFSLTFTIPWGFLTAVLLIFGRMSAESELIALRASGVSISRICAPVALMAVLLSLLCLWINTMVAPMAQEKMRATLFQIATSNPIAMFRDDQVIDEFPGRKIYVERKEGNSLHNILVYNFDDDEIPVVVIHAQEGELTTDIENQQVLMKLTDARYEQRDPDEPRDLSRIRQGITMKEVTLPISLQELYEKNQKRRKISQKTIGELLRTSDENEIVAARTEVSKRFSFSLASLAFALVGVPLAITAHRKESSIGFLFSLIIAFVYFFFIILATTVRDNPKFHPELLIWLPNVIFLTLGAFLFRRLARQ